MSIGELAGLIAAIAFVVLVIFACLSLSRLSNTLKETNKTITTLTDDVDRLSHQTSELLDQTSTLLDDINSKSREIDPAFQAVAKVGQSVSDVNDAVRKVVDKHEERKNKIPRFVRTAAQTVALSSWRKYSQRRQMKKEGVQHD